MAARIARLAAEEGPLKSIAAEAAAASRHMAPSHAARRWCGWCSSVDTVPPSLLSTEPSLNDPRRPENRDPRWDTRAFDQLCEECQVGFLSVGYLRQLKQQGGILPARNSTFPAGTLHVGAPPPLVQLYSVDQRWEAPHHPDPDGRQLGFVVEWLDSDDAFDNDLVWWDYASLWQSPRTETDAHVRTDSQGGGALRHVPSVQGDRGSP